MKRVNNLEKNIITTQKTPLKLQFYPSTKPYLNLLKPYLNPTNVSKFSSFDTLRRFTTSESSGDYETDSDVEIDEWEDEEDYDPKVFFFTKGRNEKEIKGIKRKGNERKGKVTDSDVETEEWEEEDDSDPKIGDGGAGGGVVLQNTPWGEKVLSIAHEVLKPFGDDFKLFAFKTRPTGYIYVRIDKLTNEYGCPSQEEVKSYHSEYKKRLEEEGIKGDIPDDLGVQVSSPGANRLLMIPDDLQRFKEIPMTVVYVEEGETLARPQEKTGVFYLDTIETNLEHCVWKLAYVKANRDPASKGKPFNRKQRDWRLKLHYKMIKKATLYVD